MDTSVHQYKPAQVLKENYKKQQDESPLIGRTMIQTKPMFAKTKPSRIRNKTMGGMADDIGRMLATTSTV